MKVRAALTAVLIGSLTVSAVGVSSAGANTGGSATMDRAAPVTVTGTFEHVAVDAVDGEGIRYAVRGVDESWWLDGVPEPAPAPGAAVEVTGTPLDEYTLSVATIRVTTGVGDTSALARTAAVRGRTRVLVMRAFWGPRPPARPTKATATKKVINDSARWFREVSGGRYSVSGVVTPWLRISRPNGCHQGAFTAMNQALSAAQRAGYQLSRFQRGILYLPCNNGGVLGLATVPGQHVWLFGSTSLNVVTHEQGHNLGLRHASSRECINRARRVVTWSRRCRVTEYGDEIDTMGNRRAGHYNSNYKSRLRWLNSAATVRRTRKVLLAPYERRGRGVKAIRLRAGRAIYWLEYRTRTGADAKMLPGTQGVQIRYQAGVQTQLLDAGPGSTAGFYDLADPHLPAGSSWTTPQNVRITVVRQARSSATVAFKYRAGAPKAPFAPGPVRVQALNNAVRITWTRPADRGAILRRYVITRSGGGTRIITTFAGLRRSYTWTGLNPNTTYRFSVQAVNEAGMSAKATSPAVRPR